MDDRALQTRVIRFADSFTRRWCKDHDVPADAWDDALQTARYEALTKLYAYAPDRGALLEEWVRQRLRTRLARWLQTQRQGGITGAQHDYLFFVEPTYEGGEEDTTAVSELDARNLLRVIAKLPEKDRLLLQKYYTEYGDLTQTGLATELGVSQQAVARRIAHAVKKIRAELLVNPGTRGDLIRGERSEPRPATSTRKAARPKRAEQATSINPVYSELCESRGYPYGVSPGKLSTKYNGWVADTKFWTKDRHALLRSAATTYAAERALFSILNDLEQTRDTETLMDDIHHGWDESNDEDGIPFLLAQANPRTPPKASNDDTPED